MFETINQQTNNQTFAEEKALPHEGFTMVEP